MLLLAIRLEIEVIFKNQYPKFFSEELHDKIAMKLINDLITQLFDPNLFFSRFSFLESNREAINIKYQKSKQQSNSSSQADSSRDPHWSRSCSQAPQKAR